MPWELRHVAAGINVLLKSKPEIVSELPDGAVANKHSKQLKSFITQDTVSAGYYHDCKELSREQLEKALNQFALHYNNYQNGKMPGAQLSGIKPKDNEIILNLEIALDNICNQNETPFLSKNSANDGNELFEKNFF